MRIASIYTILFLIIVITNSTMLPSIEALEIERHSKLLGDIIYSEIYSYKSLIEWLNEIMFLNIDIVENPLENSILLDRETANNILNSVYSDDRVAVLIGGIQLRMLKKYAGLKPFINESDVVNLVIAIIKDNNITLNSIRCDNILDKFIVYIVRPFNDELRKSLCQWKINDLELYAKYILSLQNPSSNSTMIINIIRYLYVLRIAANNGIIDSDMLNKMLEDVSTKYSIITALFMKTFIYNYNIRIVDRRPYDRRGEIRISLTHTTYNINDVNRDIDLTEALIKALLIIEKLKEKNIDIEDINVFKLIDTLMNIDIKEYHIDMNNIDDIISGISEDIEEPAPHTQVGISYNYSNGIRINSQIYYYLEPWYDYENDIILVQHGNLKEISASNILNLNEDLTVDSQSLMELLERDLVKEIIEYSNKPNVEIANTKIVHISFTVDTQSGANKIALSRESHTLLLIIILIAVGVFLSTIFIGKKIKPFLKQFIYISKGFSTRSKMIQTMSDNIKTRVFVEFWNTMYKFAKEHNLKVEDSHTHREIKQLITSILNIDSLKILLERITYLYEVLRYSNEENNRLLEELTETLSIIKNLLKE